MTEDLYKTICTAINEKCEGEGEYEIEVEIDGIFYAIELHVTQCCIYSRPATYFDPPEETDRCDVYIDNIYAYDEDGEDVACDISSEDLTRIENATTWYIS